MSTNIPTNAELNIADKDGNYIFVHPQTNTNQVIDKITGKPLSEVLTILQEEISNGGGSNEDYNSILQSIVDLNTITEGIIREADAEELKLSQLKKVVDDNAPKWSAGYDTYTRFQGTCKIIDDWNVPNLNGLYMGSETAKNAPSAHWHMGLTIVHNDRWVQQKVIRFGDMYNKFEFERFKVDGVWGPWVSIFKSHTTRVDNANADTFIIPGIYALGANIQMVPSDASWGTLTVTVSGDVITQTIKLHTGRIYHRGFGAGQGWTPWNCVASPNVNVEQLFQSVSSGKTAVASAISDKGVYTSPVETFANMANNIRLIGGLKFAKGYANGNNRLDIPAGSFGFTPKVIITRHSVGNDAFTSFFVADPAMISVQFGQTISYYNGSYRVSGVSTTLRNGGFVTDVRPFYYEAIGSVEWLAIG